MEKEVNWRNYHLPVRFNFQFFSACVCRRRFCKQTFLDTVKYTQVVLKWLCKKKTTEKQAGAFYYIEFVRHENLLMCINHSILLLNFIVYNPKIVFDYNNLGSESHTTFQFHLSSPNPLTPHTNTLTNASKSLTMNWICTRTMRQVH